jgi:uncharacterized protein (DUF952 family)
MPDRVAYKVLTAAQWAQWQRDGQFRGAPVDAADGFIHLSAAAQLAGTLDRHFAGQAGLVVAAVDLRPLGDAVRWERSRGGQLFPHLYAALPLAAVIAHGPLERAADGAVVLPGGDSRAALG